MPKTVETKISGRKKILVVDDEADMITFITRLLANDGFQSVIALSKSEAVLKVKAEQPHCIILNAMMAGDEGIQIYFTLKADKSLSGLPVILLSSVGPKAFFHYPQLPEPEAYLEHPPDAGELIRQVRMLVNNEYSKKGGQ